MHKILPILFSVALTATATTACASNPDYSPQPLAYYPAPAFPPAPTEYASPYEHMTDAHREMGASLRSPVRTFKVTWTLKPASRYRPAKRDNCVITIRDEFQSSAPRYECLGVVKTGQDYSLIVKNEAGQEEEILLSEIKGGFVGESSFYEEGVLGLEYRGRGTVEITWSSHKPVRGE